MLGDGVWKGRLFRWCGRLGTNQNTSKLILRPKLRINRDDGGVSLDLQLVNDAGMTVWVEDATIVLTDLDAIWQTSIPNGQARHEIRQNVRANESLELSLAGAIYDAAGRAEGRYACFMGVVVRCRVGEEWFNKALDTYRVEMTGLEARSLHRLRWYEKKARPSDRPV